MLNTFIQMINNINEFKHNFLTLKFFESIQWSFDPESILLMLDWLLLLFMIFMIGASFCGFFQCMIYRKDKGINLWITRSFCDVCGKTLQWADPVPFINYLILKGKCRYCHAKLPVKYFLSETLSGIVILILLFSPLNILFALPLALFMIFVNAYVLYFNRLNRIIIGFLAFFIGLFLVIYGFGGLNILISLGLMLLLGFFDFRMKPSEFHLDFLVFLCLFSLIIHPLGVAVGAILARIFSIMFSLSRTIYLYQNPKDEGKPADIKNLKNTISLIGYYMGFLIYLAFYYS